VICLSYSQRYSVINHCDRHITLFSDTDTVVVRDIAWQITMIDTSLYLVILIQYSQRYSVIISDCTVLVSLNRVICLSQWFVMLYSDCTVSVSLNRGICLSQWFITVILIQYSQRYSVINHCDRHITLFSDTDIVQSEI
jgi:hypothetical protein